MPFYMNVNISEHRFTMPGDSFLRPFNVLMFLLLLWMAGTAVCQECNTTGLNEFGGYQYIFYHGADNVYRTFDETRAHCQSLGGDAAVITSAEQHAFIISTLYEGNYWIGLEDMDNDGAYTWIDGTQPGYTNWDTQLYSGSDQPAPYCSVISLPQGKWNRRSCTSARRHICQIPIDGCSWHELVESQYLIKAGPIATVDDARATCQSYGGDLAMIKTAEINTFTKDLLPPSTSSQPYFCYWFGLQRSPGGAFTWLDGTSLEYNDWYIITEPNNFNSWGCLGLRSGPTWYGQSKNLRFAYICERTRVFDESSEASFGGIDYFISPSWLDRSYSDARTYCQYHGADLALIKSEDINTFLQASGLRPDTCSFFGLTDQTIEGTFTWIDGTPLRYSPWYPGDPNDDGGNEDCVCLQSHESMTWWDVSCSIIRPFICERYQEYEWSRLGGTEYYISQSSMASYSFARRFCQTQGGNLAQPKTEEINMHLIQLAEGNSYWFGLDDLNQTDTLQWTDGTLLDNNIFPTWSDSDATFMENERCVHQQVNNGWRKLPCTSYLRFACEKPLILPGFNGSPVILNSGPNHVLIGWKQWDPETDTGKGPVVGYKIYVRSSNRLVLTKEVQAPNTECNTDRSVTKSSADATIMVIYTISGLEAGTTYTVQIAAIRDGLNGEGEPGTAVTITTETLIVTTTDVTELTGAVTTEYPCLEPGGQNGCIVSWVPFGISMLGNIILAGVIALLCFKIRRTTARPPPASSKVVSNASPEYENPVFDASKTDEHNYQDIVKVNKEDNYEEIRERQLADYVSTSDM